MKHAKVNDRVPLDQYVRHHSRRVCQSVALVGWCAWTWTLGDAYGRDAVVTTRERFRVRVMSGRSPYWDHGLQHQHRTPEGYRRWLAICWNLPTSGKVALYIGRGMWTDLQVAKIMARGIAK